MIKKRCERAYRLFGDKYYQRLSGTYVSHLYNLRASTTCQQQQQQQQQGQDAA
jgi:hypothetical protein